MDALEVFRVFDLPWELKEMIYRYLVKMMILDKLDFPKPIHLYFSKGTVRERFSFDFSYCSDSDEYYQIYRTAHHEWFFDI